MEYFEETVVFLLTVIVICVLYAAYKIVQVVDNIDDIGNDISRPVVDAINDVDLGVKNVL